MVYRQVTDGDGGDKRSGNGYFEPRPDTLMHLDHGVQFTPWVFTRRASYSGLVALLGSIGGCHGQRRARNFLGRMQAELVNRNRWKTRVEVVDAMFEYLEIFHNRQAGIVPSEC